MATLISQPRESPLAYSGTLKKISIAFDFWALIHMFLAGCKQRSQSEMTMLIMSWRSLSSMELLHRKATALPMCRSSSREKRFLMIVKVWQSLAFCSLALSAQWTWTHQSWNTHSKVFQKLFLELDMLKMSPKDWALHNKPSAKHW